MFGSRELNHPEKIGVDDLVAQLHREYPGRVTTISYSGLKFALDCGIEVWDYCETLALAAVIANHGTAEQKIRLQQEIYAGRRASEMGST